MKADSLTDNVQPHPSLGNKETDINGMRSVTQGLKLVLNQVN